MTVLQILKKASGVVMISFFSREDVCFQMAGGSYMETNEQIGRVSFALRLLTYAEGTVGLLLDFVHEKMTLKVRIEKQT